MARLLLLAALALSGCYKVQLVNVAPGGTGIQKNVKVHTLIGGLVPLNEIDVDSICKGKPAVQVGTVHSFVDLLVSGITGGIYAPVTVKVTCGA